MCLFCKIINQEIPSYTIYQDELVIVFLDIKPVSPGHCLIIPKQHRSQLEDASSDELAQIMLVIKKIAQQVADKLGSSGYNLIVNNGAVAGQEIAHLHFHLIPRYPDDGLKGMPQQEVSQDKLNLVFNKLKFS